MDGTSYSMVLMNSYSDLAVLPSSFVSGCPQEYFSLQALACFLWVEAGTDLR